MKELFQKMMIKSYHLNIRSFSFALLLFFSFPYLLAQRINSLPGEFTD